MAASLVSTEVSMVKIVTRTWEVNDEYYSASD
jgi:hypothetical protein